MCEVTNIYCATDSLSNYPTGRVRLVLPAVEISPSSSIDIQSCMHGKLSDIPGPYPLDCSVLERLVAGQQRPLGDQSAVEYQTCLIQVGSHPVAGRFWSPGNGRPVAQLIGHTHRVIGGTIGSHRPIVPPITPKSPSGYGPLGGN